MTAENYRSVYAPFSFERVIERSRFIAHCAHAAGEEQARAFLARIRAEHAAATHNCYAFIADRTGNMLRFSDDGEPQGTAGLPILEVLRSKKLFETVVVVTRYFGGIKLGAGGLVRAYAGVTADALAQADVRTYKLCRALTLRVGYEQFDALKKYLDKAPCAVRGIDYTEKVEARVAVTRESEPAFCAALLDFLAGRAAVCAGEEFWYPFRGGEADR